MRILVTGATGFVGRHFVEAALAARHQVVGLSRPGSTDKQGVARDLEARGAALYPGDVNDKPSLHAAMRDSNCVAHFASAFRESGVPDEYFKETNVNGTINMLEVAAEHGVKRFVFCSTAGIYGSRVPGVIDETAGLRPWNVYEQSKVDAEVAVRRIAAERGMEYAIVRPAVVYGPHDERLVKMFKAAAKGRFPLFGAGEGRRHMVYVGDVVDATLRACLLPQAAGHEMIIAGPRAAPLREILDVLAETVQRSSCGPRLPLWPMMALAALTEDVSKLMGFRPPIYRRRMDFYRNDAAFDTSKARAVLGWRPTVDLHEGFDRTYRAYREAGLV